ncbi:MAG: hypothetical protein KatS3mg012_1988 [Gaiellaceae bacterium]|jgi:PAS domain S-box-containing protein|nr:MAG: hypothetical protein KatS3mg012_1988 [Gaiellaceae bacterium]
MSPLRALRLRLGSGASKVDQRALFGLACLLAAGIFALALALAELGDALLFLLALPLALGAMASGLRGGIALGLLCSVLAGAWWLERAYPEDGAWLASHVLACLLVGALLGGIVESRLRLGRALEHLREHSLDLIATASFDGYFTSVNPAFTRTLGYSAEELLSRPFLDFVHPDDVEATLAAVAELTQEGRDVLDFRNRYRTKDGSYRWLEWRTKPDLAARELIAVARDVTDRKRLEEHEHAYYERLEREVAERTSELELRNAELEEARRELLHRLALAAEYRDDDTFAHTERIRVSVALLAHELGLPDEEVALLREAAPLHDIGKLGVSDTVLLKPGTLSSEEVAHMRAHTVLGARLLSGSSSRVLQLAEEIARGHHEWWDGSGYPHGLRGEEIPLCARIVAVADVFDALTHARPYKPAWSVEEAVAEIRRLSGRQFDPRVVDAFCRLDPYRLAAIDDVHKQVA